uniref:Uncharacterized protein C10orf118 homolog n=1 Tax=Saccoglossus kowalevskii TaxID=10224 RepID=A0ABM0GNQ8_SACKO|nr:PREDICTED: uncharacterized protein C10orf118 homolog [Saccoglossus kowalevskii]
MDPGVRDDSDVSETVVVNEDACHSNEGSENTECVDNNGVDGNNADSLIDMIDTELNDKDSIISGDGEVELGAEKPNSEINKPENSQSTVPVIITSCESDSENNTDETCVKQTNDGTQSTTELKTSCESEDDHGDQAATTIESNDTDSIMCSKEVELEVKEPNSEINTQENSQRTVPVIITSCESDSEINTDEIGMQSTAEKKISDECGDEHCDQAATTTENSDTDSVISSGKIELETEKPNNETNIPDNSQRTVPVIITSCESDPENNTDKTCVEPSNDGTQSTTELKTSRESEDKHVEQAAITTESNITDCTSVTCNGQQEHTITNASIEIEHQNTGAASESSKNACVVNEQQQPELEKTVETERLQQCADVVSEMSASDLSQTQPDSEEGSLSEMSVESDFLATGMLPNGLNRDMAISQLPEYKELLEKCETMYKRCEEQQQHIQRLQKSGQEKNRELQLAHQAANTLRSDIQRVQAKESSTIETYQTTVKQLQAAVEYQKREVSQSREKLMSHDVAAKKALSKLQKEMATRVDQVRKMYEDKVKEKEAMVIKFAQSEIELLEQKKISENFEKRIVEQNKQMEGAMVQIKTIRSERNKVKSVLEGKDTEISNLQKVVDKQKEDISSQNIKVKWAQNKLKTELEGHNETKLKLQKTEAKLIEAREETEQIRNNCKEMIKTYQENEEIKSNSLNIELKMKLSELETEKRHKSDQEEIFHQVNKELESLKRTLKSKSSENNLLTEKVSRLEQEKSQNENVLVQFKETLNNQKEENRKLAKQLHQLKMLEDELKTERATVQRLEEELETLETNNTDLESDRRSNNKKQSELLQFTEKMTAKNTELISENNTLKIKVETLTTENKNLTEMCNELKTSTTKLSSELQEEKKLRQEENDLLTNKLEEKSKAVEELTVQLEDMKDEIRTLKRKHAANIKDLSRQLQSTKKRLDNTEVSTNIPGPAPNKETLNTGSRTSSNGSIDTSTVPASHVYSSSSMAAPPMVVTRTPSQDRDHGDSSGGGSDVPSINKAMLIERIVKLQKASHRKTEKIDFLEDHVNQLLDEIQKKTKIIQQFVLREQSGALAPASMDVNKAKMAKQGGIMASLYKSHAVDPGMTLDLSLEINRKLQAVLEDTLLKNITLKENIDTLGDEIARLSEHGICTDIKGTKRKS